MPEREETNFFRNGASLRRELHGSSRLRQAVAFHDAPRSTIRALTRRRTANAGGAANDKNLCAIATSIASTRSNAAKAPGHAREADRQDNSDESGDDSDARVHADDVKSPSRSIQRKGLSSDDMRSTKIPRPSARLRTVGTNIGAIVCHCGSITQISNWLLGRTS